MRRFPGIEGKIVAREAPAHEHMTAKPWVIGAMAAAIALLLAPVASRASLGQDEASAETDRAHLNGQRAMRARAAHAAYAVQELQLPSGTTVREYVSSSGKIFAVSWQGPTLPDLEQIMGADHYKTFMHAPDARQVPRRLRSLRRDELVVHSAGRPRAFSGHAYIPALVPPGVQVEELR